MVKKKKKEKEMEKNWNKKDKATTANTPVCGVSDKVYEEHAL